MNDRANLIYYQRYRTVNLKKTQMEKAYNKNILILYEYIFKHKMTLTLINQ